MPPLLPPDPPINARNRVMDDAPDAYWDSVLAELGERIGLPGEHGPRLPLGKSPVFEIGDDAILKLSPPYYAEDTAREVAALQSVPPDGPVRTPRVISVHDVDGWTALLISRLPGTLLRREWPSLDDDVRAALAFETGKIAAWLHSLPVSPDSPLAYDWQAHIVGEMEYAPRELPDTLLATWPAFLESIGPIPSPDAPLVLLHGDLSAGNLHVEQQQDGQWHITGLLDFGDASLGQPIHDWLSPRVHDLKEGSRLLHAFRDGYGLPSGALTSQFQSELLARTILYYGWRFVERTFALQGATDWHEITGVVWPL